MTVAELIAKLTAFAPNWEVTVTDGYQSEFYQGDFDIVEFEGTVDIGIGGLNLGEPGNNTTEGDDGK